METETDYTQIEDTQQPEYTAAAEDESYSNTSQDLITKVVRLLGAIPPAPTPTHVPALASASNPTPIPTATAAPAAQQHRIKVDKQDMKVLSAMLAETTLRVMREEGVPPEYGATSLLSRAGHKALTSVSKCTLLSNDPLRAALRDLLQCRNRSHHFVADIGRTVDDLYSMKQSAPAELGRRKALLTSAPTLTTANNTSTVPTPTAATTKTSTVPNPTAATTNTSTVPTPTAATTITIASSALSTTSTQLAVLHQQQQQLELEAAQHLATFHQKKEEQRKQLAEQKKKEADETSKAAGEKKEKKRLHKEKNDVDVVVVGKGSKRARKNR
ncbi:hypothetical protein B484DRAFT_405714 [Ochromonadaceae sp. CCMP2298]|nr:hypothetical protein B484DRAFT_405714 [Ochromonadaceae sp. CCMP2298]